MFKKFFRKNKSKFSNFQNKFPKEILTKLVLSSTAVQLTSKEQEITIEIPPVEIIKRIPENHIVKGYLSYFIDVFLILPLLFFGWKGAFLAYFLLSIRDLNFSVGNFLLGIRTVREDGTKMTLVDSMNHNSLFSCLFWVMGCKILKYYFELIFLRQEKVISPPSIYTPVDLLFFYAVNCIHFYNVYIYWSKNQTKYIYEKKEKKI